MSLSISQLTAVAAAVADELEAARLSATITLTRTDISAASADNSFNTAGGNFVTAGFAVGQRVKVAGFTGNVANNITSGVLTSVASGKIIVGGTDGDVIVDDAAGESVTIAAWQSVRVNAQALALLGQGTGLDVDANGFRGVPQNSQSGNYTTVAADAGKHLIHPSGAGSGDTITIDSNANVAYEIGTTITFVNLDSNAVSIAITSDTMYLAGVGTAGTRTLAQYGVATALKVGSTTWLINGTGLT